jgi:signal transduction histidine kinase
VKKILIIDDNPQDRMLYRRFLSPQEGLESLEIHDATDGAEGIALFRQVCPDCILLDYNLPDTDGLAMLGRLSELAPPDTLCIVMITGGGSESLAVRALNNGALDYLVKQKFDRELLNKTVRHAIEKNEWRQYVARYHSELQGVNRELRDSLAALTTTRQELHEKNEQLSSANAEIIARNRQLARTNQDLDNFVYAASHDLRQPVNNLRGLFDELRLSATFHDPEEATVLRLIDEALNNLSTTISDLAAVVQEQRQPTVQTAERVAWPDLLADTLLALRPQLQATGAAVESSFDALPELEYVRSNLRTILLNLLSNALKYRHPARHPEVHIRTYQEEGCPVLEVRDNGLGMDLERYGHELFHLFRRFHPQAGEGTGVGLFLVNRLVQSVGGHITVESTEQQGTTFRIYLCASQPVRPFALAEA